MASIVQLIIGAMVVIAFLWLLAGGRSVTSMKDGEFIDPNNSQQLGTLIGLAGGDISDAAVARFALQRFQEIHGRRATTRDIGTVVGLMRTM